MSICLSVCLFICMNKFFSFLFFTLFSYLFSPSFFSHERLPYSHTRTRTHTRTHKYIWIYVPPYDSYMFLQKDVSEESYSFDCIISYLIWLEKIIIIILLQWYYLNAINIHWIMIVIFIVIVIVVVIICNESMYISSCLVLSCLESTSRHDVVWARVTLPYHIIPYHISCSFILSLLLIWSPFYSILLNSILFYWIWFNLLFCIVSHINEWFVSVRLSVCVFICMNKFFSYLFPLLFFTLFSLLFSFLMIVFLTNTHTHWHTNTYEYMFLLMTLTYSFKSL